MCIEVATPEGRVREGDGFSEKESGRSGEAAAAAKLLYATCY